MRRILLAALAPLALLTSGCAGFLDTVNAPAPLEQTVIDEKAIVLALSTFDTVLTAVDALKASGHITPGSPKALTLARHIDTARLALEAASAAQRAGSTSSYFTAIEQARVAIGLVKEALK